MADGEDGFGGGDEGGGELGELPEAGHDGEGGGAVFEKDFGCGGAGAKGKGVGDGFGTHGGALEGGVLAAGAAKRVEWAGKALGGAGEADGCAELHHGLVEVAGQGGMEEGGGEGVDGAGEGGLVGGVGRAEAGEALDDALDVAVYDGDGLVVSDGGNGGGGVEPDAGEGAEACGGGGKDAGVVLGDGLGGGVHHAGATVVAEAAPEGEDGGLGRGGEGVDGGEGGEEGLVFVEDGGDAGLLEHDFRDPDGVGVAGGAPGEVAAVEVEPGEERLTEEREVGWGGEGAAHGSIVDAGDWWVFRLWKLTVGK